MSSQSPAEATAPKRATFGAGGTGAAPGGVGGGGGAGGIGTTVAATVAASVHTPPCFWNTCTALVPAPTKSRVPSNTSDVPNASYTAADGPVIVCASCQPAPLLRYT